MVEAALGCIHVGGCCTRLVDDSATVEASGPIAVASMRCSDSLDRFAFRPPAGRSACRVAALAGRGRPLACPIPLSGRTPPGRHRWPVRRRRRRSTARL